MQLPYFQGVTIPAHYGLADRVKWYSVWVQSHPHQTLHFFHERLKSGFFSEPGASITGAGLVITRGKL